VEKFFHASCHGRVFGEIYVIELLSAVKLFFILMYNNP